MPFMNEYEIEDADRFIEADDFVRRAAIATLRNLVDWTNRNSDGWCYWPKPCRAAEKLQRLIQTGTRYHSSPDAVTVADLKVALRPVKAFRTRHNADFLIVEP